MAHVCMLIWNILVFGTTTYLVFFTEPGYSGWWYLLAIILAGTVECCRNKC